jgi:2-polyprenyl-3-methyl-5-hydroxy-6-metoxy-1,4-benzoquinol methylase
MTNDPPLQLDAEALASFARKGFEGGPDVPQAGEANAVKVRRVMQLTADLAPGRFGQLRILDLGCGEGVYSIEAGLRGATVLALDARDQRMAEGVDCAARHGLEKVAFVQEDVRSVDRRTHGEFDVVYLLGLLYHLDVPDVFSLLERVRDLCRGFVVLDTLISEDATDEVAWRGQAYRGRRVREHADEDPADVRRSRVLRSIDNAFGFRFTRRSLLEALHTAGFTSVLECHVPFEPDKPEDRITLVAFGGSPVLLSTYPWINLKSEAEIERRLRPQTQ